MATGQKEVWVTGIGLVSSLGEGSDNHWARLSSGASQQPVLDCTSFAPYPVHPLTDLDFSKQIPRRGDQRQMGQWQRLGTYAAGLALCDAKIAGIGEYIEKTNIIVAAGAGERDITADELVLDAYYSSDKSATALNSALQSELRPTLFLSQLSNLLAGNISIVHNVSGSSRTFMGEEMAGVSAVEVALRKIKTGQDELILVGGAYIAERLDMLLLYQLGNLLWANDYQSVWTRSSSGGGMVTGSVGAFLVLEEKDHAEARNARPYARIADVQSGRCYKTARDSKRNAEAQFDAIRYLLKEGPLGVLSGSSGLETATSDERSFLEGIREMGFDVGVRAFGTMLGHSVEAQFPAGLALASVALSKGGYFDPFDNSEFEQPVAGVVDSILVTTWGQTIGEGLGLVEAIS